MATRQQTEKKIARLQRTIQEKQAKRAGLAASIDQDKAALQTLRTELAGLPKERKAKVGAANGTR